jgi:hypothetical protein
MGPLASSIIWVCIIIVFQTHDGTFGMFNNLTISHNTWNPTLVSESTQTLLLHVRAPHKFVFGDKDPFFYSAVPINNLFLLNPSLSTTKENSSY